MVVGKALQDISVTLGGGAIDYPGDRPYSRSLDLSLAAGGLCDLSHLELSAHSGTHLDAPAHFLEGGKTLDQFPLERFALPARVVEVMDHHLVTPAALAGVEVAPGEALLFKTENSRSGRCRSGRFTERYVAISPAAAAALVELGVTLVGLDYITIEPFGSERFEAHKALLGAEVLLLEGLDLSSVEAGRYELLCLPLRMKGAEASPVRAILVG